MKQHLAQDIKQNIQRSTGKRVEALVCMTVYEDGDVSAHSTDNIQQSPDDIFVSNAKESLRTSLLEVEPNHEMHSMSPLPDQTTTTDSHSQGAAQSHSER